MSSHEQGFGLMSDIDLIFHVDDDPDILELARMSLEMVGGFSIEQANDPLKALDMLDGLKPSLFLFDVMMPVFTGPQLFQELRKRPGYEDVPVIFMTAKAQALQTNELEGEGVIGVVAKPFDPMTMPDEIRRLWSEWS